MKMSDNKLSFAYGSWKLNRGVKLLDYFPVVYLERHQENHVSLIVRHKDGQTFLRYKNCI